MAQYSGWSNWETWQMAMILSNKEGDLKEKVLGDLEESGAAEFLSRGHLINQVASVMEDEIRKELPEIPFPWEGFFMSVFDKVAWAELAENSMKRWRILTKKGRMPPSGPREWSP